MQLVGAVIFSFNGKPQAPARRRCPVEWMIYSLNRDLAYHTWEILQARRRLRLVIKRRRNSRHRGCPGGSTASTLLAELDAVAVGSGFLISDGDSWRC
jgi:hypothetical protein